MVDTTVLPNLGVTSTPKNTRLDGVADDEYIAKLARQSDPDWAAGPQNINWLGSSYSGADIKVVAHLYKKQGNHWLKGFQEDKEFSDRAVSFLTNMINGGLEAFETFRAQIRGALIDGEIEYEGLRERWFKLAGVSETEISSEFRGYVLSFFNDMMDPKASVAQIILTKAKMTKELSDQRKLVEYFTTRIEKLQNLAAVGTQTQVLGTLQTISVQTHREKYGVRALGKSYVKGYTRGPRTIAGSMIFTVFHEHALTRLIKAMDGSGQYGESALDTNISTLIPDQLPPIDLTVIFANEYGTFSRMGIYGVEFMNDSQTYSIEDIMTEGVMNFVARDIDIMTSVGMMRLSRTERGIFSYGETKPLTGSELLITGKEQYEEYIRGLGIRRGFMNR